MSLKRSVGLVLITMNRGVYTALLSRRAVLNTKKNCRESFPGCLQVSCHGKLKEGEEFNQALWRELREKLGNRFTDWLRRSPVDLQKVHEVKNAEQEVETWGAYIPHEFVELIQDINDVSRWIPMSECELDIIVPITKEMKENGAPKGTLAMFPDEIKAVRTAFEIVAIPV